MELLFPEALFTVQQYLRCSMNDVRPLKTTTQIFNLCSLSNMEAFSV